MINVLDQNNVGHLMFAPAHSGARNSMLKLNAFNQSAKFSTGRGHPISTLNEMLKNCSVSTTFLIIFVETAPNASAALKPARPAMTTKMAAMPAEAAVLSGHSRQRVPLL